MLTDNAAIAGPAPVIAESLAQLIEDDVQLLVSAENFEQCPTTLAKHTHRAAIPAETPSEVAAFLNHWSPDFCVVIGRPNTPQLLQAAAQRGIALYHASPARSGGGQARFPTYLQYFDTCLAASATEAEAMRQQFRGKDLSIEIVGPLSDTVLPPPCNDAECDQLANLLGGRPVWLAALVSGDELEMVERAHRKAFRSAHRLLLILAPGDPAEAPKIAQRLEERGWRVGLRSRGDEPDTEIQIYIADTTGEMGLWYRLAPSTFVGGTFLPATLPADPFEPASLGSAVLHGPHTGKAPARFERLGSQGASILVSNAEELGEAVITLLSPDKAASLAQAGWSTTTESAHVVERLADLMLDVVETRREPA